MFFKNSTTPQVRSGAAASARSTIPSLLSADIRIRGDIRSRGEVQVDGAIEGDVVGDCVVVSELGTVTGTIAAQTLRIFGTVNGTVTAGSIKLARTARVTGDIVHEALSIEEGAFVLGQLRRAEPDQLRAAKGADATEDTGCAQPADCGPVQPETADIEDDKIAGDDGMTIPALAR